MIFYRKQSYLSEIINFSMKNIKNIKKAIKYRLDITQIT